MTIIFGREEENEEQVNQADENALSFVGLFMARLGEFIKFPLSDGGEGGENAERKNFGCGKKATDPDEGTDGDPKCECAYGAVFHGVFAGWTWAPVMPKRRSRFA